MVNLVNSTIIVGLLFLVVIIYTKYSFTHISNIGDSDLSKAEEEDESEDQGRHTQFQTDRYLVNRLAEAIHSGTALERADLRTWAARKPHRIIIWQPDSQHHTPSLQSHWFWHWTSLGLLVPAPSRY